MSNEDGNHTDSPNEDVLNGIRIRNIRDSLGLTQKGFADKIGISRYAIYMLENNKRKLNEEETKKLLLLKDNQGAVISNDQKASSKYHMFIFPKRKTWKDWEISQKGSYLAIISTFVIAPIISLAVLTYSFGQKANLAVTVVEGDSCILEFKNTGGSTIVVDLIDSDLWYTVIFVPSYSEQGNAIDFLQQYSKAVGMDKIAKILDVRGLELGPSESINRKIVSRLTEHGTFASYDLRFKYRYRPSSSVLNIAHKILLALNLVKDKTEVYVRFDGYEFSQISLQVLNKRESLEEYRASQSILRESIESKNPEAAAKLKALELEDKEFKNDFRKRFNDWSNEKIINFTVHVINRIPNSKGKEQINACRLLWLLYGILDERGIPFDHGFDTLGDIIKYHTAMDNLLEEKNIGASP